MKQRRHLDIWQIVSFAILALYALFLIIPMFQLLRNSVMDDAGGFTL